MLELDDIQHILLTRTPAITGRYEFLYLRHAGRRPSLAVGTARPRAVRGRRDRHHGREPTVDHVGVHVDRATRARRTRGVAGELSRRVPRRDGITRRHSRRHRPDHPDKSVGGLAGDDVHAIAILFARDDEQSGYPSTPFGGGIRKLLRRPAAIDDQRRAGHQPRRIARQEHDRAGELVHLPDAAELDLAQHLLAERLVLEERPGQRRLDEGRRRPSSPGCRAAPARSPSPW